MSRPAFSKASCRAAADVEAGIAEPSKEDGISKIGDSSDRRKSKSKEKEEKTQDASSAPKLRARAPNKRPGASA